MEESRGVGNERATREDKQERNAAASGGCRGDVVDNGLRGGFWAPLWMAGHVESGRGRLPLEMMK